MIVKDVIDEVNKIQLNAKYVDNYIQVISDEHISDVLAEVYQELLRYAELLSSLSVDSDFNL